MSVFIEVIDKAVSLKRRITQNGGADVRIDKVDFHVRTGQDLDGTHLTYSKLAAVIGEMNRKYNA